VEPKEEEKHKKRILRPELPSSEVYREKVAETLRSSFVVLLVIFIVSNVSCLSLLFLNGFGVTNLSDAVLCALIAATVAEIAGLMTMVYKRQVFRS
jgi:hypothetical protein